MVLAVLVVVGLVWFVLGLLQYFGQIRLERKLVKPILVMIVSIFYGYAVFRLGFYTASILFYFLVTYMTGIRNYKVMGAVAVVLFPLMYLFFNLALGADLPEGILI